MVAQIGCPIKIPQTATTTLQAGRALRFSVGKFFLSGRNQLAGTLSSGIGGRQAIGDNSNFKMSEGSVSSGYCVVSSNGHTTNGAGAATPPPEGGSSGGGGSSGKRKRVEASLQATAGQNSGRLEKNMKKPLSLPLVSALLDYYTSIPDMLSLLSVLIGVPSVSDITKAVEGAPFGIEVRRALDVAISAADKLGFETYVDAEGYFGFAEFGDGDEVVLIVPHLDVVPGGNSEDWEPSSPYALFVGTDGKMMGRGVQDDKGPAVAVLYSMAKLKNLPILKNRRVRILFSLSEETGNKAGIEAYRRKFGDPYIALAPDGDFPASIEQGFVQLKLSGTGKLLTDLRSVKNDAGVKIISISTGDNRANQVPAEVDIAFAFRGLSELSRIEKLMFDRLGKRLQVLARDDDRRELKLRVKGKAAHAAQPWEGVNPVQLLAQALEGVYISDGPALRAIRFIQNKIGYSWRGKKLGIAVGDPATTGVQTFNVGTLIASDEGISNFAIDSRVRLDLRIEDVKNIIVKAAEEAGFSAETLRYVPPQAPSIESPIFAILRNAYEGATESKENVRIMGVRTDATSFSGARMLSVCYGGVPCGVRTTYHEKPEVSSVDAFLLGGEVYLRAGFELAVDSVAAEKLQIRMTDSQLEKLDKMRKRYKLNSRRIRQIRRSSKHSY